jgi:xylan 1,4-beta-xylosidase
VKGGGYRADPRHRKQPPPSVQHVLRCTQTGYEIISAHPQFRDLECVLSEIDPDGWAAGGTWDNSNLNFRNTEYYPSFVAAMFEQVSAFARRERWDVRLLSWAFLFVGERCFEGTRTFSTQGIDKAILNLFRIYARMGTQAVAFSSSAAQDPLAYDDLWGMDAPSSVSGFATLSGSRALEVLIFNHHDDWDRWEECVIDLEVANLPFGSQDVTVHHYRIDAEHSNAYAEWLRQGRPMYPAPGQLRAIKAREGLELFEPPRSVPVSGGRLALRFALPVHGISLVCLTPGT